MPRGILPEVKLHAVKDYISGNGTHQSHASNLGVNEAAFKKWVDKYKTFGESAFLRTGHNQSYCASLKKDVVKAYLNGEGSYRELAVKYRISSGDTVRQWVLKYNKHEKLNDYETGENAIMTKGRKTTFEERIEIASYCISHDHNYAETAEKFCVSYQQARNYTVKYENGGIDALQDNRGKRKPEDTLTEIERLRAELKLEKAKRQKAEMEASFLKKLNEIERRRG